MLSENLKRLRKAKGLTQEELAARLNVVRQTVSKWEKGLSVPDSEMLIELSNQLDTPVAALLGESIDTAGTEESIAAISENLSRINAQLAKNANRRRQLFRGLAMAGIACVLLRLCIYVFTSCPPFNGSGDAAIIGGADGPTAIFVSSATMGGAELLLLAGILILSIAGIILTRKR
jgi:putative transcriptional regulator